MAYVAVDDDDDDDNAANYLFSRSIPAVRQTSSLQAGVTHLGFLSGGPNDVAETYCIPWPRRRQCEGV